MKVDDSNDQMLRLGSFADIIVTDPPFGFNAFEGEPDKMQNLYSRLARALVHSLKPWGQLILALPAFAKNGKQIPYYQTRESLTKQILSEVEAQSRKCVSFVETLPGEKGMIGPPWYWVVLVPLNEEYLILLLDRV